MSSETKEESIVKYKHRIGGHRPKGSTGRTREEIIQICEDKGLYLDKNQLIDNTRKPKLAYTEEGYKVLVKQPERIKQGMIPFVFSHNNPHSVWNIRNVWLPNNAPDYELLSDTYTMKDKLKWRLKNSHLPDFYMKWHQFKILKRHPSIGNELGRKNKTRTTEEALEIIYDTINNNPKYEEWTFFEDEYEYFDSSDILIFKHEKGYVGCQTFQSLATGNGLRKYNVAHIKSSTYNLHHWDKTENTAERLKPHQEYRGTGNKYIFICEKHGEFKKWLQDAFNGVICAQCEINARAGKNHPLWRPEMSEEDRKERRKDHAYYLWRKNVYKRDSYTCQCCYSTKDIVAHHLDGFNWCIEKRVDIDNGVVLCKECHSTSNLAFHRLYGNGFNTKKQFQEWIDTYQEEIIRLKSKK